MNAFTKHDRHDALEVPMSMLFPLPVLRRGAQAATWLFTASPHLCVGRPEQRFLFGGTAFAACIGAMEQTLNLPVNFASAQFIAFAQPHDELTLSVELLADGKSTKQARVSIRKDDGLILTAQAALGRRASSIVQQSTAVPDVPAPLDCPSASMARLLSSNINNLFEVRLARGRLPGAEPWNGPAPGPILFWVRARDGTPLSREALAIFGDFFSIGISAAIGRNASGNSLDNHIRFIAPPDGEWLLCMIEIEAVRDGIVHGNMRQFGQDGQLFAIASQSMILRVRE
ncbi:MAG: thioesterase family protein [Novosphingobium sp.]